jgi:hypothetical protein
MTIETDGKGHVITKPVTGYTLAPVAGIAVLLAIRYVESPEELESGTSKQIQFVLTPPQCLEIAGAMTRQAERLRGERLPPGKSPN